jgi:hypothetical protein
MTSEPDAREDSPETESSETMDERHDRHWTEILQELRVTQTGTQILTGFLLTLPFQSRFKELDPAQVGIYLALVIVAGLTTVLALAPVSLHRALFRQGVKERMVKLANYILKATLVGVATVLTGTVLLIFDVVGGLTIGIVAASAILVITVLVWIGLPALVHPRRSR